MEMKMEIQEIYFRDTGIYLDRKEHRYFDHPGKEYSGITGLLNKHISGTDWSKINTVALKIALDYGTGVHAAIEKWVKTGEIEEQYRYEVKSFIDLITKERIEMLRAEYIVSDLKKYASPIDIVGRKDGKVVLLDIKTGSTINKKMVGWQLSVYRYFMGIVNPAVEVDGLYCVHFVNREANLIDMANYEVSDEEVQRLFQAEASGTTYGEEVVSMSGFNEAQALVVISELTDFLEETKRLKTEIEKRENFLKKMVEELPAFTLENEFFRFTKKADSERRTIDTKRLQEEQPEIYEDYLKFTPVRGGIVYKLKK